MTQGTKNTLGVLLACAIVAAAGLFLAAKNQHQVETQKKISAYETRAAELLRYKPFKCSLAQEQQVKDMAKADFIFVPVQAAITCRDDGWTTIRFDDVSASYQTTDG